MFYSKRLNLFINKDFTVYFLDNNINPLKLNEGIIKNLIIEDKEVIRIFDTESDPRTISCCSLLEGDRIFATYVSEFESKFIVSENSNEIAIISNEII